MKKVQVPHRKLSIKQAEAWLMRYRKIILPVLSALGVAFFIVFDYEYYPWLSLLSCCAIMCYIIFLLLRITRFCVTRDSEGNLVLYDKRDWEESSSTGEQKRLEQEKADIEKRLEELKKQSHEQD